MMWLLKLINPVKAIAKELAEWQTKKLDATTEQQRIEAEVQVAALEAQRDLLLKEQDNFFTRNMRPMFAAPFVFYLWKAVGWDKVVKGNWEQGVTDPLGDELWLVFMTIVAAYFSFRGAEKLIKRYRG